MADWSRRCDETESRPFGIAPEGLDEDSASAVGVAVRCRSRASLISGSTYVPAGRAMPALDASTDPTDVAPFLPDDGLSERQASYLLSN